VVKVIQFSSLYLVFNSSFKNKAVSTPCSSFSLQFTFFLSSQGFTVIMEEIQDKETTVSSTPFISREIELEEENKELKQRLSNIEIMLDMVLKRLDSRPAEVQKTPSQSAAEPVSRTVTDFDDLSGDAYKEFRVKDTVREKIIEVEYDQSSVLNSKEETNHNQFCEKEEKIKMPSNLPKFRGKDGIKDPEEFINRFNRLCMANGVSKSHFGAILIANLENNEANWLERWMQAFLKVKSHQPTWEEISEEFLKHFRNINSKMEWEFKLRNLKMTSDVQFYSDEFLTLMYKAGWISTSETAIYQYKLGLPKWIVTQLNTIEGQYILSVESFGEGTPPISIEMLIKLACRIEANSQIHNGDEFKDKDKVWKKSERSKIECRRCGKLGHIAAVCLASKPVQSTVISKSNRTNSDNINKSTSNTPKQSSFACFNCGSKDHSVSNCPKKHISKKLDPSVKRLDIKSVDSISSTWTPVIKDCSLTSQSSKQCVNENSLSSAIPQEDVAKRMFESVTSNIVDVESKSIKSKQDEAIKSVKSIENHLEVHNSLKYGIHTPCILEGVRIIAFVDGGASTSFVSKKFVEKMKWIIEPKPGQLHQALSGTNILRIGVVKGKLLENGTHSIFADLEVAELGDNETLIIGLDLFTRLSYSIEGVPFTWPQPKMNIDSLPELDGPLVRPSGIDQQGIAEDWKEVLRDNQSLPKNSRCKLINSELTIETEGKPVWIRQYSVPEGYRQAVDAKVQEWIDSGLVSPAPPNCQWNLPLLGARKPGKDGEPDGVRVCFDARELNKRIINVPDSNLPTLREIQDSLGQFEWISIIDLADSYHQFSIREEDRHKTAFSWGKFGHLMFNGVPFGLKTMTAHMQRIMEKLMARFGIKPFQDDIAIASKDAESHKKDVLEVLKVLTYEAGLKLRLSKCKFFMKEVRVLGSIISGSGIRMDPEKVQAIINWPKPCDGKAMQRFLGAANFHRDFSPEYATIAAPLESLRNIKGQIVWTDIQNNAFEQLKVLFASNLMLRTIDWTKKLYLTTDASIIGIGAWIGQMDLDGNLVPVICISKKLSPTQQRWSATKRELYAVMWAMQRFRHYLLGRNFIIRVDHKPLIDLLKNKMSLIMEGWIDTILQFDFTTQYIPGCENELADALSRCHNESIKSINVAADSRNVLLELEAVRRGKNIPNMEEQKTLLEKAHAFGHFSVNTTFKQLWSDGYWWPRMRDDIREYISKCTECQKFDVFRHGYHPMKSIEADEPWDHIQIDLIGPLPMSTNEFRWILTIIDVMTGYTILRALKNKTETETATHLWNLICDFGVPKIIQSDQGAEFVNNVIHQLTSLYGIDHRIISSYHPRADGLVERRNKEIGRILKKQMHAATNRWELWLSFIQLSLNMKELDRTGSIPFELFFGRPFNKFDDWSNTSFANVSEIVRTRLEKLLQLKNIILPTIASRTSSKRSKRNTNFNQTKKILPPLAPGTKVMVLDSTRESKWDPLYEGPFTVLQQTSGGSYILQDTDGTKIPRKYVISQLKPLLSISFKKGGNVSKSADISISDEDEQHYVVKKILDHKSDKNGKGYEYLVRWKDYKEEDDSWVHESMFDGDKLIKHYWKERNKDGKIWSKKYKRKI